MPQGPRIPAIVPRNGAGHQFVCYADSCSGIAAGLHESTFASVNQVVARLEPLPEFICFPGDEIAGLTSDDEALRKQWSHWLNSEMGWLDRRSIPLYHTTGNHTTFDEASERVFCETLAHLPRNGPPGEEGLTYFIRRGDLLMVFVNTACSRLGGEGRVEIEWLDRTLQQHADARHKLVFGHHPAFTVNGFAGAFQRDIAPENGRAFWQVLVRRRVCAYFCSHILAFDVQTHDGVLQVVTAGAGTAHRMPPEYEYLHCVQAAIDRDGLRYQVLDTQGRVREWLEWPLRPLDPSEWIPLEHGENTVRIPDLPRAEIPHARLLAWRVSGVGAAASNGSPQTLIGACGGGTGLTPFWVGLTGIEQRLCVVLSPEPTRSPHYWHGPTFDRGRPFSFQLAVHTGMGPGGILCRSDDNGPWSSLLAASAWGAERLSWPAQWTVGNGPRGPCDRPFQGSDLRVARQRKDLAMSP